MSKYPSFPVDHPTVLPPDKRFELYRIRETQVRLPIMCVCRTTPRFTYASTEKAPKLAVCSQCNGKGWHYKSFPFYKIAKYPEIIERISPGRFYTSSCDFWPADRLGDLVFFTKEAAQAGCDTKNQRFYTIRNKIRGSRLLKGHLKPMS